MLGFLSATAVDEAVAGFLATTPNPTMADVASFLELYSGSERELAAQLLVQRGVSATTISSARAYTDLHSSFPSMSIKISPFWMVLSTASMAASAYHGYKRNQSIGWALVWGFFGAIAPVITPVIGVAQGFGKRKAA